MYLLPSRKMVRRVNCINVFLRIVKRHIQLKNRQWCGESCQTASIKASTSCRQMGVWVILAFNYKNSLIAEACLQPDEHIVDFVGLVGESLQLVDNTQQQEDVQQDIYRHEYENKGHEPQDFAADAAGMVWDMQASLCHMSRIWVMLCQHQRMICKAKTCWKCRNKTDPGVDSIILCYPGQEDKSDSCCQQHWSLEILNACMSSRVLCLTALEPISLSIS